MTDHDLHALSGAYAVDALDDDERAHFEAHLELCAECREEVASLQEAAGLLGTEPVEPPSALRDAVLTGIASIRPLPPITSTTPAATTATPAPVDDLSARRSRRTLLQQVSRTPLLVAAAAVLLLAVGTAWLRPWGEDPAQRPLTAAEQVLAAADATSVDKEFPDGSRATVTVSRSKGKAVIETEDMAPAPDGKVYELWLQRPDGAMVPAGLMPDDPDAQVILAGDASLAKAVGITVEPDGGSEIPTTTPLAVLPLDT